MPQGDDRAMSCDEAVTAIRTARDELIAAGFLVISEEGPNREAFGDRSTELAREACRVLLLLDRGEPYVTMRAPTGRGDYGLDLWEACLDARDPVLEIEGFASDIGLLLRRLPEFERLAADGGR